jgi:SulP family sulfate permease
LSCFALARSKSFSISIYFRSQLAGDVAGGIAAALIALPYGLAMANMMGLPPVLGLVTSVVTAPITTVLGKNPLLIGGAASATVPFISRATAAHGVAGAAEICLLASLFMLLLGVLKLGRQIRKVPQPVVTGFSCGIGAMMVLSQLGPLLGLKTVIDRTSNNLLYQSWQILADARHLQPGALVISVAVIAGAFITTAISHKAPAPLIGVLAAVVLTLIFHLHQKEIGSLPLAVPNLAVSWKLSDVFSQTPSALALASISSVNLLITSRVVEHFRGRHKPMKQSDADAELGAYGLANAAAAVLGAPLSVGIPARSLASVRCGASTRMSNLFHAIFIVLFVAIGRTYISHVPIAALAGVTAYVGICLLEWGTWRRLPKMRKVDALAFLATAVAVLLTNAVLAVAIGCAFYPMRWAYRQLKLSRLRSAKIVTEPRL